MPLVGFGATTCVTGFFSYSRTDSTITGFLDDTGGSESKTLCSFDTRVPIDKVVSVMYKDIPSTEPGWGARFVGIEGVDTERKLAYGSPEGIHTEALFDNFNGPDDSMSPLVFPAAVCT